MQPTLAFHWGKRLPSLLQDEASECGLACLAMISNYHRHHTELRELRAKFPGSLKGTTLGAIADMSESIGLVPRALKLEPEELSLVVTPAILHWRMNHFVVLKAVHGDSIVIHDPAVGQLTVPFEQVRREMTGVALELTPGFDFKQKKRSNSISLSQVIGKASGLSRALVHLLSLALAIEAFSLVAPLLTQWITDEAILSADSDLLTVLGLAALAIGLISVVLGWLRSWVALYVTTHFSMQWMANVMAHLLRLPVEFFEKRHIGDVVSRFGSVNTITQTITSSSVDIVLNTTIVIGGLVMMLLYSPPLALVPVIAVGGYAILRWLRYSAVKLATAGFFAKQAKEQSFFLETIRGARSIKMFAREAERRAGWLRLWVEQTNAHLTMLKLNLMFGTTWNALATVERVLVLWIGARMVINHGMSLGMLFAFLAYKEQFSGRFSAIIDSVAELKMLSVSTDRLSDIVMHPVEERGNERVEDIDDFTIGLDRVNFRYAPGESLILSQVSLQVAPGECVAIVGPSGAGKTTLLKLLLGILQPSGGTVKLGNLSLIRIGLRNYRLLSAAVMQDDHLFAGSVLENICFLDKKFDLDLAQQSAKAARVHDEIMAMPMGYYTLVGDMGTALSGGQKQRIVLARALYREPKILFLDEATSNLDLENERRIGEAIAGLAITRIIIAHRPQTVAVADRVLQLKHGKLIDVTERYKLGVATKLAVA